MGACCSKPTEKDNETKPLLDSDYDEDSMKTRDAPSEGPENLNQQRDVRNQIEKNNKLFTSHQEQRISYRENNKRQSGLKIIPEPDVQNEQKEKLTQEINQIREEMKPKNQLIPKEEVVVIKDIQNSAPTLVIQDKSDLISFEKEKQPNINVEIKENLVIVLEETKTEILKETPNQILTKTSNETPNDDSDNNNKNKLIQEEITNQKKETETPKEILTGTPNETKEILTKTSNEIAKEILKETSNEIPKEILTKTSNETPKEILTETSNEIPKEILTETSNETPKEILTKTSNEIPKEILTETSNETPKEILTKTSNETPNDDSDNNNKNKLIQEEITNQKKETETPKEILTKTSNEIPKETPKETPNNDSDYKNKFVQQEITNQKKEIEIPEENLKINSENNQNQISDNNEKITLTKEQEIETIITKTLVENNQNLNLEQFKEENQIPTKEKLCELYEALFNFNGEKEHSIPLKTKDIIAIIFEDKSGWWKAKNMNSKQIGFVPYNYIKKMNKRVPIPIPLNQLPEEDQFSEEEEERNDEKNREENENKENKEEEKKEKNDEKNREENEEEKNKEEKMKSNSGYSTQRIKIKQAQKPKILELQERLLQQKMGVFTGDD